MLLCLLPEEINRFVWGSEWNQIAKGFTAGKNIDGAAIIFGNKMSHQRFGIEARIFEMKVVEQRVLNFGFCQIPRQALFPNPFRNPHPPNLASESIFEPSGETRDLADSISRGDHRQYRLIERAANDFYSAGCNQSRQSIEVFRMSLGQPFDQRTACV